MFNLQMNPPVWAQEAMRFTWLSSAFEDDTAATKIFQGHLFYCAAVMIMVPLVHIGVVKAIEACIKSELPEILQPPLVRKETHILPNQSLPQYLC